MRVSRKCPLCGGDVKVTKTFTPDPNSERSEKLQLIKCSWCGLRGNVSVLSSVTWLNLSLVSAGQRKAKPD